ncbi:MAG: hypothetical protein JXA33_10790 [Anaerolineae bacterium]|nr:hypothetical protein [Anaerolineae bacterium]
MRNRKYSMLLGGVLILLGGLSLIANLAAAIFGWDWGLWRLWPLMVISVGIFLVLTPLLVHGKRGLGGMYIPGVPVLVTGGILMLTSVFNWWEAWEWLWPLEVLSMAAGFLFASLYMRNIWLLIPAIIIGANGLLFQFCALTGWWEVWAALWTIEPFSVGAALLVMYLAKRRKGLLIAGAILCGIAIIGLMGMTAILPGWWFLNLMGPAILLGAGVILLLTSLSGRSLTRKVITE